MKNELSILPWEYRGSGANTTPHAATELEIGGKRRHFLLRIRDGIIYFKEPKLSSVFAVPRLFENQMGGDDLVNAWRGEVEHGNYGRFAWRPVDAQKSPASTVVTAIHRRDYSGWISDAFAVDWNEIPRHRDSKELELWQWHTALPTWRAIKRKRDSWTERIMPPSERQNIEVRWVIGNEEELRKMFAIVMRLYTRASHNDVVQTWRFGATNPASEGGWCDTSFSPNHHKHVDLRFSSTLHPLLRVLQQHFVLVGMTWLNFLTVPRSRGSDIDSTRAKWGEEWRGNFRIGTPEISLEARISAQLSHHEKLELLLELRDWLDSKVPPRRSANWLSKALD